MRLSFIAAAWLLAVPLSACGGSSSSEGEPALTITPSSSGAAQISGPTTFTAVLVHSTDAITWTTTAGALSGTSGRSTTLTPPTGTATMTLTATAGRLTASVQVASAPMVMTSKRIAGLSGPVAVEYDAQDIPHVLCAQAADCLAVQGYLQARDRLFPMDFLRHVARGKLAELIGDAGLSQDIQMRTLFTTRDGKRIEDELVKSMASDPASVQLLTAFVAGINAYLTELKADASAQLPGEYAQLPFRLTPADIEPWTPQDSLAVARLNQFQLSESLTSELANGVFAAVYAPGGTHADPGKFAAWLRSSSPATERAHTLSASGAQAQRPVRPRADRAASDLGRWQPALRAAAERTAALRDRLRPADATVGSNNWVVAATKSATGVAIVANDPHLSLQYPPLFHLAALTSSNPADGLDLTGGAFPGIPGALVGRGAHVGWGVTVVGYDVTDVYKEQFVPQAGCPSAAPCVVFKAGLVPLLVQHESFKIRTGAGTSFGTTTSDVTIVPHHGPMIQAPDARTGIGLSFRWTGHETNTRDVRAFYGLATARSVDDAVLALKDYATGAQNFVLADDQGHIAYDPHALVPVREFAVSDNANRPWLPLPGDGTAEWGPAGTDCTAPGGVPAACWIADDKLPFGKDPAKGYFFTANADPVGTSDDNEPRPAPGDDAAAHPYLSFDWDDSTGFRATRIEEMIEAALAAGGGKLTLADMVKIQSDHRSRPGKAFAPFLAALPDAPAELAAAKPILAQWASNGFDCPSGLVGGDPKTSAADPDPTVSQNSAGCFLFHVFLRALISNVFSDDLAVTGQSINAVAALKALLTMLGPDPAHPLPADATTFCNDNDRTAGALVTAHTCQDQLATALAQAYRTLTSQVGSDPKTWLWGRVHTIQPVSLLAPLVTTGYAPGPYARPGGAFTVDVGTPALSGIGLDFSYRSGGNVRHISLMDPASPTVKMQLPGPERDGPTVTLGPDLLGQWVKNQYFDFSFGAQSHAVAIATQTFQAP